MDENGSTLVPIPREGPLDEDEASSLTAWAQGYREVRKTSAIRSRDVVTINPSQAVSKKVVRKTMFGKKPPRRDRNIRTPFRDKARDHSTERVTGAELRKTHPLLPLQTTWTYGERRECQNPAPKDITQSSAKNLFLPGDAFAQLHNFVV